MSEAVNFNDDDLVYRWQSPTTEAEPGETE